MVRSHTHTCTLHLIRKLCFCAHVSIIWDRHINTLFYGTSCFEVSLNFGTWLYFWWSGIVRIIGCLNSIWWHTCPSSEKNSRLFEDPVNFVKTFLAFCCLWETKWIWQLSNSLAYCDLFDKWVVLILMHIKHLWPAISVFSENLCRTVLHLLPVCQLCVLGQIKLYGS